LTLKQIVEESDTRAGRVFDLTVQALVVFSLVGFSIETLPDLSPRTRWLLRLSEIGTVSIFTAEYLLRWVVADRKLGFALSFFGLVDLLAILPFYIGLGVDLRSIRVVRLLRLFRILKLTRYSAAVQRLHRALIIAREDLVLFGSTAVILLYVASVGVYFFERDAQPEHFASIFHSLWWAVVTLTTVGYGDVVPVTVGGRMFTGVVLVLGLGVIAVPTGLVASALSQARREVEDLEGERRR